MVFAAGKIIKSKGEFRIIDNAQVAVNAGFETMLILSYPGR